LLTGADSGTFPKNGGEEVGKGVNLRLFTRQEFWDKRGTKKRDRFGARLSWVLGVGLGKKEKSFNCWNVLSKGSDVSGRLKATSEKRKPWVLKSLPAPLHCWARYGLAGLGGREKS